jgi:hypothetical protein
VYLQLASNVVDKPASGVRLGVVKYDPAAHAVFPQQSNEAQKTQGKAPARPGEGGILNQDPIIFPMPCPLTHSDERLPPTELAPGNTFDFQRNSLGLQRRSQKMAVFLDSIRRFIASPEQCHAPFFH